MQVTSAFAVDFSKFNHMVVFGDSLSDNGNSFFLSDQTSPPFPPYGSTFNRTNQTFPGRWTDGRNWVDYFPYVAHHFCPVTAFYLDRINGTNVAVGGSTSANLLQTGPKGFPPAQIRDYVESKPGRRIPSDDLYVIWVGANDPSAGITTPRTTVENIRKAVAALAEAGAKDFIVIDLPDISLTPDVKALLPAAVQEAKQFVAAVNLLLAVEIPQSAWLERVNINLVDINTIFVPLVMNPAFFGFSNSVDAAFNPGTGDIAEHPDDYVFWDGFHPTTRAHLLAARFIYRSASRRLDFSVLSSR
jgi:phospholipase/lecithinase/hemolysin